MRKKLLLINPVNIMRAGFSANRSSRFPPLNLGIVAALTPDNWDVELIDENFEEFSYREADLVGLTAFTSSANRAYNIAQQYRDRGTPVLMGGVHCSMRPEEAKEYVDCIVLGEVETVWPQMIEDFEAGKLQEQYRGEWRDLTELPIARRDIYNPGYLFASIQTSRGCPLDCDFCSVTAYNGRRYRRRPPSQVLDELETIPQQLLFFVDDNIIGYGTESRRQALELFQGMVERGLDKSWFCQASVNIADDPEVLEWASRAGCRMIFLGIEAEDEEALSEVNKRLNLKRGTDAYAETFNRIHQAGIAVLGAFIFGMDGDTPEKLYRRAQYMINSDVDVMQATIMTPLPGTQLFHRMQAEQRLLFTDFPNDWDRYNLTEVVHRPLTSEAGRLLEVIQECCQQVYDLKVIKKKAKQTLKATGNWESMEFAYKSNLNYRNIALANGTVV